MNKLFLQILFLILVLTSCDNRDIGIDNPEVILTIPEGFPKLNNAFYTNKPTQFGAKLGEKLFNDKRLSADNSVSCGSCHIQKAAFADNNVQAIGLKGRVGLRNVPPIQNLAFMKFYNWDGSKLQLETQPIVPIITHEEMDTSILEVIGKLKKDNFYKELFTKAYGDSDITPERIYKSIAQYEYTLISANSKYDIVMKKQGETFSLRESRGFETFKQKCSGCHSGELFTDQSFRNIGFPLNMNTNEAGRARVTGILSDYMAFRVPSLRNVEYTAPYGSFGQFADLKVLLDYLGTGVLAFENLDPILKENSNRIPLTEQEKEDLIEFMKTLSDREFTKHY